MKKILITFALMLGCGDTTQGCTHVDGGWTTWPTQQEATEWEGGTACWIVEGWVPCKWDMSDGSSYMDMLDVDGSMDMSINSGEQ